VFADSGSASVYQSALSAYQAKEYLETVHLTELAVKLDPTLWQAWQLDGNARMALGDANGAEVAYHYALQLNPANHDLQQYVDQVSRGRGRPPADQVESQSSSVLVPSTSKGPGRLSVELGPSFTAPRLSAARHALNELNDKAVSGIVSSGGSAKGSVAMPSVVPQMYLRTTVHVYGGLYMMLLAKYAFPVSIVKNLSIQYPSLAVNDEARFTLSTLQLMAGAGYSLGSASTIHGEGMLSLGWEHVGMELKDVSTETMPLSRTSEYSVPYSGSVLAIEMGAVALYPVTSHIEAVLEIHYLLANLAALKATRNVDGIVHVVRGDPYRTIFNQAPVRWDLGGIGAGMGARYHF